MGFSAAEPAPIIDLSTLPLQYFKPHGYQPMHMTNEHLHGAHKLLTSLQCDDDVSGKTSIAASRLEIDEPETIKQIIFLYSYIAS